jgi:hypothetical protein
MPAPPAMTVFQKLPSLLITTETKSAADDRGQRGSEKGISGAFLPDPCYPCPSVAEVSQEREVKLFLVSRRIAGDVDRSQIIFDTG